MKLGVSFRVDEDVFFATVDDGALETGLGEASAPDVLITSDAATFRRFENGEALDALAETGEFRVEGSKRALTRFQRLFALPPRAKATVRSKL